MSDDNSPQLGGQQSDNAPMISGRGTKIIVSARGAYEARNLPALFDAMSPDQQILFRQAAVREMLAHLRPAAEQAAESQPAIYDTLRALDAWLASSAPIAEGVYTNPTDTRFGDVSPIEGKLRGLEVAAIFTAHNAIGYATDALLYVPDDDIPQQPHYLIMQSELEDWIFEVGWAILHGRNVPPLHLDAARIEALIGDVERWYRKGNLPTLVQLMDENQEDRFKQAVRHQAMWYVDRVPANRWSDHETDVIGMARGWLADLSKLTQKTLSEARSAFVSSHFPLCAVFAEDDPDEEHVYYALAALSVAHHTYWVLEGGSRTPSRWGMEETARQWQLDTAYAILTDQPIPPLGDPQ